MCIVGLELVGFWIAMENGPGKEPPSKGMSGHTHRTALLRFLFFHLPQQTVSSRLRDHTGSGKTLSTGDCIWNEWKNMGEGEDHSADVNFSKHFRNLWTYDDKSKKTDLLQTGRKLTCVNFLNGSVEPRDWVSWEKLFSGKSLPVKPSEDKM